MKTAETYPPNYETICLFLSPPEHSLFCYGDTIYNPSKREILPDAIHHESVHSKQQGDNPDVWYNKYLTDGSFRLLQEVEAYGEQFIFAKDAIHKAGETNKMADWVLSTMAQALSTDYKLDISYGEAESKIRNYAKYR